MKWKCPECGAVYDKDTVVFLDGWFINPKDDKIHCIICLKWVVPIQEKEVI